MAQFTGTFTGHSINHWIQLNGGAISLQIYFANTFGTAGSANCVIDGVSYRFQVSSSTTFAFHQVPFSNTNVSSTVDLRPFLAKMIELGYATHLVVAAIHIHLIVYGKGTAIINQ